MANSPKTDPKSADALVNVICMKWGTKYGAEYVNRLYAGVRKHLKRPHRFVCFTDDATGIDPGVEIKPLPSLGLPPGPERGWLKLATFAPTLADLTGTTLFLDIDVIITASLDAFFEPAGEFFIIRDWKRPGTKVGNSSVYRFVIGAHPQVLSEFVADVDKVKRDHRNEQEYLTAVMARDGALNYWPADWCVSYKKKCIPKFPASLWRAPACPADTRVVVFHGNPKPEEAMIGVGNKWYRPALAAPWIKDAWFGEKA